MPEGQEADHFIGSEGPDIYVETKQGGLFVLQLSERKTPTWIAVDRIEQDADQTYSHGFGECQQSMPEFLDFIVRPLPRTTIDKMDWWYEPHAEYHGYVRFVIADAGSV